MAGSSAATLSIEIMANIAQLQESVRKVERDLGRMSGVSRSTTKAVNDNFSSIGRSAEQAAADIAAYGQEMDRLRAKYNPQFAAIQQYRSALADIRQAHRVGAISADEMGAAIARQRAQSLGTLRGLRGLNDGYSGLDKTSGKTAFGMRNLGFQMQDLGVQFASAAQSSDPLRMALMALVQQGPQIKDAMEQAELSVGGLVKRLGTGAARFGVFAAAAGAGIYHLKQFTSEMESSRGTDQFIQSLGLTADEIKELENATISFGDVALGTWDVVSGGIWNVIGPAVTAARGWFDEWFNHMNAEGAKLINNLVGFFVGGFNAIGAVWSKLPAAIGDVTVSTANSVIAAINKMIQLAVNAMNGLITAANSVLSKLGMEIGTLTAPQVGAIINKHAGAGADAGEAFVNAYQAAQKDYWGQFSGAVGDATWKRFTDRMRGQAAEMIGDRPDASNRANRAKGLDAEAQALKRATDAANRYIESLTGETARIGKNAIEIKRMEVAANAAAAAKAGLTDLAQKIIEAGEAWEKATRAQANKDFENNVIAPLEREYQLLGLSGPAREKAALALEKEAKMAEWSAAGMTDLNAKWEEYLAKGTRNIDKEEALRRTAEEAKMLNDQLRDMIGLLGDLGTVGNALGGLLGIFTGNTSAVGGPLGELLNIETGNMRWSDREKRDVAETIGDRISDVFRKGGEFSKTVQAFAEALKGAGTGMVSANFLGMNSTTEQIGAALGGAAGKALGTAIGGPLGGAIGSVLGGIAGGFVGGLFKKTKSGGATITGPDQFSTFGNSSSRRDAAGDLAGSVLSGLDSIAKALGGTVGSFNTTIGIRGNDYRVNGTGTSLKTSKGAVDFGQDAQAAVAYAIELAIKQGALLGLRAGTKALLEKEGDLETQLQKALAFEGVFRDLKAMTNPLIGGLEDLAAKGKQLTEIFAEAGASAEEFAQLQEYMTRQQQALIDQISSTYRSTFFTDAENLALAKKTIKDTLTPLGKGSVDTVAEYKALVKATDALANPELYGTLMELADEFGVIQDAADAAKEAAAAAKALAEAIAAQKGALEVELLKAQGKTLEATAKQREMELAAMDASLRSLQKQVWAHQDLADVYERESANLQSTIDTFAKLGDSLREFRRGLYQTDDATSAYALRLAELQRVGNLAGLGDKDAMGLLPGVGQDFLEIAKKQAGSLQEYQRDVARVARYADSAIGAADGMVSEAQAQLDVLQEQVSQFIQLNDTALSIEAALQAMVVPVSEAPQSNQDIATRLDRNNELLERLHIAIESGALASIDTARILRRTTRNGLALVTTTEDA